MELSEAIDGGDGADDRVSDLVDGGVDDPVDDPGRLARGLLAVGLGVAAIASLRRGRRLLGVLAGAGAVAVAYRMASDTTATDPVDVVTPDEDDGSRDDTDGSGVADDALRCAACGQPITTGQARGPNDDGETVHVDCEQSAD